MQAYDSDLDNIEAVYRIDLDMTSPPVNVSEAVAAAWLELHPYAKPVDFPPIVENSAAARQSRLVLDRDGAADLANDLDRERRVA